MESHTKFIVGIIIALFVLNSIGDVVANYKGFRSQGQSKLTVNPTANGIESIPSIASNPEDITPKDDAFHGSNDCVAAEWWYFDAIFDNNYSLHVGITTFSIRGYGIISPVLEIYENTKVMIDLREIYPIQHFQISKKIPFIKSEETILEFDQKRYNDTGEWVYNVSLKIDDQEVDLRFIGTTKGWKIDEWVVPLPKANVSGVLVLNGNTIKVSGIGYHDHNWNISSYTFIKDNGWYWGKIRGNTLNVVWSKIMQIPLEERLIAVLNQDDQDKGGYINIDPENIHFYASDYRWDHGRLIPTKFALYIHDDGIDVNVTMETLSIHHVDIPLPLYWRYHVRIVGLISFHLDGETVREDVDNIQIMEFMSFR